MGEERALEDDRREFGAALESTQRYLDRDPRVGDSGKIYARVRVGQVEVLAMVDTGAPWCIIPPPQGPDASTEDTRAELTIRGEQVFGRLTRSHLVLVADAGTDIEIEATFFVPESEHFADDGEWHYPYFIGLDGALCRLQLGIDASPKALLHFGRVCI